MAAKLIVAVTVDKFLTNTRVINCLDVNCKHHEPDAYNCKLKEITLNKEGECEHLNNDVDS